MNRLILFLFLLITLSSGAAEKDYRVIPFESFGEGEVMKYRVHYGFVTAGEATMVVDNKLYRLNDRPCYRIDVFGETTGLADGLFSIDNNWGTFLDTAAVIPHKSYQFIKEGGYRRNRIVDFDQQQRLARLNKLHKESRELVEVEEYEVPQNVQDMVSGYYYLRTLNYDKMKEGQIIAVDAFFDGEIYDFKVRYLGKEKIKTRLGRKRAVVLEPIMPDNEVFEGGNPIKVWISDDQYKIPLKVRANLLVGAVEVDIKEFRPGR
ncbi:DUF3108 domain-containing protein [Nafulsella turpanensis]|uniref:DUF3108 domain-containing protein n=1 Tax=Nafulsella turpanensis TaxID=1265690 RepID=UPI000346559F|nr:DUF3108 domain-containing protein [Nafulsella turpanensis]